MPVVVNELARRGLRLPVLVGGAAINRKFGRRILFLEDSQQPYEPGVFYCKDAFEGLAVMDKLVVPETREAFVSEVVEEAYAELGKPAPTRRERRAGTRTVAPAPRIPAPPFWGAKTILDMPLEIVLKYLHKPELYRLSWGATNTHGAEWTALEAEFEARLARMSRDALRDGTLRPQAVYGYFPCNSDGDDLIIWDWQPFAAANGHVPERREIARFAFPRQPYGDFLCISDYFAPTDGGQVDTVALQVVTVGEAATEHFDRLQNANEYSEAYFFHGLAVQAAEATANYVNRQVVNKGLDIPAGQGKRYSWGYPACPDLSDHATVLRLLPQAADVLGLRLTESYQWIPEQSTAAIVVHHPAATYFSVGVDRVAQIVESEA
jgi:5-methyltetrahydrofolate--homocysteine methyltransferase